jgi:energy-coupling factor transport system permease protein
MTLLYKLDPRTKLLIILLLTVTVFLVNKLPTAVFMLLSFVIIRQALKIPFLGIKYLKNLSLLAVFIVLIQTLLYPGENYVLFHLFNWVLPLSREGFILSLVVICRLFSLIVLLPLLTATTSADRLATGLSALGFQYRTAFIITTALNLIPFFKEEASVIMDAQKLRGAARRGTRPGIRAYASLAVPLVLGAMRKAQISSVAMDSRAFGVYKTRTWLDKPQMKGYDFTAILICTLYIAGLLFVNYRYGFNY